MPAENAFNTSVTFTGTVVDNNNVTVRKYNILSTGSNPGEFTHGLVVTYTPQQIADRIAKDSPGAEEKWFADVTKKPAATPVRTYAIPSGGTMKDY